MKKHLKPLIVATVSISAFFTFDPTQSFGQPINESHAFLSHYNESFETFEVDGFEFRINEAGEACCSRSTTALEDTIYSFPQSVEYNGRNYIVTELCNFMSAIVNAPIPSTITYIHSSTFYKAKFITDSLIIPESVKTIGDKAFAYAHIISPTTNTNNQVLTINIKSKELNIGPWAFHNLKEVNSNLRCNVIFPEDAIHIYLDECCFGNCGIEYLKITPNVISEKFVGPFEYNNIKTVDIQEGVKEISDYMFKFVEGLDSIKLPKSVKTIGKQAFVTVPLRHIDWPDSLMEIGEAAFCKTHFDSIAIPNTVKIIGRGQFNECPQLKKVNLPAHFTEIPIALMYGCISLEEFTIAEPITKIESYAFTDCINLNTVTISKTVTNISSGAFANCYNLRKIILHNPIPPACADDIFDRLTKDFYSDCELIIPKGSEDAYRTANVWCRFLYPAGLPETIQDDEATEVSRHDSQGRTLSTPTKGINIIKMSNGTTRKEIIK